jgi:hypothetical protein
VNPKDDGNKGLERTLTDLMKATTGLIGKSVYLLLKMKNEARFLGDWFGTLDKEIVLQVSQSHLKTMNTIMKIDYL